MKGSVVATLALAGQGLGFDFGALVQDIVHKFQPAEVKAPGVDVPSLNGTGLLVTKKHDYAPNIFDPKSNPAFPGGLGNRDEDEELTLEDGGFDVVTAVMNTLVVVDFERKKALPLDLVDGQLPLNPQAFSAVGVKMKQPKQARAELMKLYSAGAYCNATSLADWSCGENCAGPANGTRLVKYIASEKEKTAGFVALNEREKLIVVSFRGSSNINNWINNAMLVLVPFDLVEIKNATIDNQLLVHRGFQIMARSLYTQVTETLEPLLAKYKDYKVAVTGHSAGGAVATLVTAALGGSGAVPFKKLTLVTFGQPRCGDAAFTTYLNSQPLTAARVTNGVDPVNILPTQEMGFHHQHNEFFLKRTNGVDSLKLCPASTHTESPECARFDVLPKKANGHYEYFGNLNTQCT